MSRELAAVSPKTYAAPALFGGFYVVYEQNPFAANGVVPFCLEGALEIFPPRLEAERFLLRSLARLFNQIKTKIRAYYITKIRG